MNETIIKYYHHFSHCLINKTIHKVNYFIVSNLDSSA